MHILILIRITFDILYLYIQLTITLHLQYHKQVKFQNNNTWHHIVSHTQFTHAVIYCTSARQQFAFIHNTMFNSKLTIQLVPVNFFTICSYKSTDYHFTIKCMSQYCKMGNIICTENMYTDTSKVEMQT